MNASKLVGGGIGGFSLSYLIVYVANRFGAHLTADDGLAIAGSIVTAATVVAHNGLKGLAKMLWSGSRNAVTGPSVNKTP